MKNEKEIIEITKTLYNHLNRIEEKYLLINQKLEILIDYLSQELKELDITFSELKIIIEEEVNDEKYKYFENLRNIIKILIKTIDQEYNLCLQVSFKLKKILLEEI